MMLVQKIFCFTSVGRWNVIKIYISKKLVWELEELRNTNTQWMFFSWILTFHAIVTPNLYLALDRKFWGKKVSFQTIIFWKIKPTNVLQKYLSTDSSFADKNNDNKIIIWRNKTRTCSKEISVAFEIQTRNSRTKSNIFTLASVAGFYENLRLSWPSRSRIFQ